MDKKLMRLIDSYKRKIKNQHDSVWLERFYELIRYKHLYGHLNVNKNNTDRKLYTWLIRQRKNFRAGKLNEEKIFQLTNIGFDLKLKETIWNKNFEKLVDFKKQHGHLQVIPTYTNDKQLVHFVGNMRARKNKLTADKIKRLDEIGFLWEPVQKIKELDFSRWLDKYRQLIAFKEKHGHCRVPVKTKEYHLLGRWVYNQLSDKKLSEEKRRLLEKLDFFENRSINVWHEKVDQLVNFKQKYGHLYVCESLAGRYLAGFVRNLRYYKRSLSEEQIKRLDEIGFIWHPGKEALAMMNRERCYSIWLKHYNELKAYREKHGDCLVPGNCKEYPLLGQWVYFQKKNKNLPEEKLRLLEEIGFFDKKKKKNQITKGILK